MFTTAQLMRLKALPMAQLDAYVRRLSPTALIDLKVAATRANAATSRGLGSMNGFFDNILSSIGRIAPIAGGLISLIPGGAIVGAAIGAAGAAAGQSNQPRPIVPLPTYNPIVPVNQPVYGPPAQASAGIDPKLIMFGGAALLAVLLLKK